jgi:hypothetical protein
VKRVMTLVGACILVAGCGPFVEVLDVRRVSSEERAAALNVDLLLPGMPRPQNMIFVGPVEATSCKNLLTDPPASRANATEQLKIKALRMGANAVVDFSCDASGTDTYGTNCWNSVSCAGSAVRLQK